MPEKRNTIREVSKKMALSRPCLLRGAIKKLFFFTFGQKGEGGGLGQSKKSLSEKTEVVKKGEGGGVSVFFD